MSEDIATIQPSTNTSWRSNNDIPARSLMVMTINLLITLGLQEWPPELMKIYKKIANQIEWSLYNSSKSFEEYIDCNTLMDRLKLYTISVVTPGIVKGEYKKTITSLPDIINSKMLYELHENGFNIVVENFLPSSSNVTSSSFETEIKEDNIGQKRMRTNEHVF